MDTSDDVLGCMDENACIMPTATYDTLCEYPMDFYDCDDVYLCDTSFMSFEMDIYPIISANCIICHGGASPTAGLALETYAQINQSATDPYYGIINRISRLEGDPLMMPGSYRLPQCQIDKIAAWVNNALNN